MNDRSPITHREGAAASRTRARAWSAVCLALLCWWGGACSPPEQKHALTRRTETFRILGETIASLASDATVVVVGNPFSVRPGADPTFREVEVASVDGLRRGMGKGATLVGPVQPALQPGALENPQSFPLPPGATTPLSFLTAPGAWDKLVAEQAKPSGKSVVLVSLIGFPADVATTKAWTDPAGPRWAMYLPDLRLLGSGEALRAAFRERRLLAVVMNRPGAPPESEPPLADARADFERRYLLVTAANLEESLTAFPRLFPP